MDLKKVESRLSCTSFIVISLALSACGGSSSNDENTETEPVTLSGTAAIGAAVSEAEVTAKCSDGSGFIDQVLSKSDGTFGGQVDRDALPCALRVSKPSEGILLHSFAVGSGITNITPLTDMTIALASSETPENWFKSPTTPDIEAAISAANLALITALETSGFEFPGDNFDPFNQAFSIGDSADQVLDEIQESLASNEVFDSYSDLIDVIKDGNITEFPLTPVGNTGGSGNTALACFNSELYQLGTLVSMVHSVTASDLTETTESIEYEVTSNDGSNVLIDEILETFNAENALVSTRSSTDDYDVPSTNGGSGLVVKNTSSYTVTYTNNAISDFSGTLALQERQDFRLTENTSSNSGGALVHTGDAVWSVIRGGLNTYIEKETITIPAGTFQACRFDLDLTYTGASNHPEYGSNPQTQFAESISLWYSVDSGVLLKSMQADGDTKELVSATINGTNI